MMTAWYQHRQPHSWTACSKQCALMAQYLMCAGGLWLSLCSVTSLSLTVNSGPSAATAVLLGQSAFMPAQMPQSLSNPCSSKHGQPGFHYGIGCLPLPDCLKSRDTKVFLLTGAGKLISTSCTLTARSTKMETAAAKLDDLQFSTVTLAGDSCSTDDASA
jgi:hypothetical protein